MTNNHNHKIKSVEAFLLEGRRINKAIQRHFLNVIRESPDDDIKKLTLTQSLILLLIFRVGKATLHELANQMDITAPSASVLVDRLYGMGLIKRETGLSDRRKITIHIHPEYMKAIARLDTDMAKKLSVIASKRGGKEFLRAHEALLESLRAGFDNSETLS